MNLYVNFMFSFEKSPQSESVNQKIRLARQ